MERLDEPAGHEGGNRDSGDSTWGEGRFGLRRPNHHSLLSVLVLFAQHKWVVIFVPVVVAVAAVVAGLVWPTYRAHSAFIPEAAGSASISQLSGLAAQFGLNIGGGADGLSADFYAALVRSSDVLRDLATTPVDSSGRGTVMEELGFERRDDPETMTRVLEKLGGLVRSRADLKSGIVTIETVSRDRTLSELMNRRLLELISDFNLSKRRTRAREERQFVEGRLEDARDSLMLAEVELRSFLERNRRFSESPRLQFEADRLQREVSRRQAVFTSLAQAYEQARIEEVRNTPVVTVVDRPEGTADRSGLAGKGVLGLVLGLGLVTVFVIGRAYLVRERETAPGLFAELDIMVPGFARFTSARVGKAGGEGGS